MKNVYLNISLIVCLLLITNAFSQVSDSVLKAMEGENVIIRLDKSHKITEGLKQKIYFHGKLQKVEQNSIVVIGVKKGNVEEIPKDLILSMRGEKINLKPIPNRLSLGALGWFVGFGTGSYVQGDVKGGTAGLIWDLINIAGIAITTSYSFGIQRINAEANVPNGSGLLAVNSVLFTFYLSTLASRIFQAVRPHKWRKKKLAFLEGVYLAPEIAHNGHVGLKGGLVYSTKF